MAYGNPSSGSAYAMGGGGGGNEDYFADSPESKGEERMTPKDHDKEDEEYGETAVIPKSLLGGKEFKPGEEMMVEIVSVHGDQVEIKYATDKGEKKESEESPPGEEPEPKGDGEMQSMME